MKRKSLRLRLFHRKMLFGKQFIFQIRFSGKLTHFPVFGSDLGKRFHVFGTHKKIIFQNTFSRKRFMVFGIYVIFIIHKHYNFILP